MEYTILQRANPLNRIAAKRFFVSLMWSIIITIRALANEISKSCTLTATKSFFAAPIWSTVITIRALVQGISKLCTLTATAVGAVLESFLQLFPLFLKNGHSIRLGNFGIFKRSFSAMGQEFKDDVSAKDISNVRVLFRPSVQLKKEPKDNLTFIKRRLL